MSAMHNRSCSIIAQSLTALTTRRMLAIAASARTEHLDPRRFVADNFSEWQPAVGVEVHVQIASTSKLFSGAPCDYLAAPNTAVSFFDCALPGTLPILNRRCVEAAVRTALCLGCTINFKSNFDRKHYFYADMPAGYQITQQRRPVAENGYMEFYVSGSAKSTPYKRQLNIERVQIEMDSGKSIHEPKNNRSLIDLNRAGVGLLEIVTGPELRSGWEAASFAEELRRKLVLFGVTEGQLQKGEFRVDANISLSRVGEPLGVRTEVKNMNSYRFVRTAVDYEIARHYQIISSGGQVENETRGYDDKGITVSMRDKEVKQDYRFMPEPNLPPLVLSQSAIIGGDPNIVAVDPIKSTLPNDNVAEKRRHYIEHLGIDINTALFITKDTKLQLEFFEECLQLASKQGTSVHLVAEFVEKIEAILTRDVDYKNMPLTAEFFLSILRLIDEKRLTLLNTFPVVKACILDEQMAKETTALKVVEKLNLVRIRDEQLIKGFVEEAVRTNAKIVKKVLSELPTLQKPDESELGHAFVRLRKEAAKLADLRVELTDFNAALLNALRNTVNK